MREERDEGQGCAQRDETHDDEDDDDDDYEDIHEREGEGEKKKTSREGEQGRDRLTDYLYSDCNSRSSRTDCTTTTAACILSSALNA